MFKGFGVFVLVPVSISWKITVVRISGIKWEKGLLTLRKITMQQFMMFKTIILNNTFAQLSSGRWFALKDENFKHQIEI